MFQPGDKIYKGHVIATVLEMPSPQSALVRFESGMGCAVGVSDYIDLKDWQELGYAQERPTHRIQIEPADLRESI